MNREDHAIISYHQSLATARVTAQVIKEKIPKKPEGGGVQLAIADAAPAGNNQRFYDASMTQANGHDICKLCTQGKCNAVGATGPAGPHSCARPNTLIHACDACGESEHTGWTCPNPP